MSAKLSQLVWEHAPYIGEKVLSLLVLAEWANDDGYCAVSIEALADRVRITEDCANTLLQEFINDGALRLVSEAINSQPAFYQMLPRCWSDDPPMKMNTSRGWIEKRAEFEDQAIINIGPRNVE